MQAADQRRSLSGTGCNCGAARHVRCLHLLIHPEEPWRYHQAPYLIGLEGLLPHQREAALEQEVLSNQMKQVKYSIEDVLHINY